MLGIKQTSVQDTLSGKKNQNHNKFGFIVGRHLLLQGKWFQSYVKTLVLFEFIYSPLTPPHHTHTIMEGERSPTETRARPFMSPCSIPTSQDHVLTKLPKINCVLSLTVCLIKLHKTKHTLEHKHRHVAGTIVFVVFDFC